MKFQTKEIIIGLLVVIVIGLTAALITMKRSQTNTIPEELIPRQSKYGKGKFQSAYEANQVHNTISKHTSEIQECYNAFLAAKPKVTSGKVAVDWNILPNGSVEKIETVQSDFSSLEFSNCIINAIKPWVFPEPPGGHSVYIAHVFNFKKVDDKSVKASK